MTLEVAPAPKENSPDLSDAEIVSATPCAGGAEVVQKLQGIRCSSCGQTVMTTRYEVRRRKPHVYWRVFGACPEKHSTVSMFRADWIKDSDP